MGRFAWFGVGLLALASACSRAPDVAVANPREVIHQEVTADADNCFLHTADYCVYDRASLDVIIDERVRIQFHGELPTMRRELTRLVRAVAMRYRSSSLETDESRALVLAKMMQRYENPPFTAQGTSVHADLGHVPTGFVERRRSWHLASTSPLMENHQPQTAHIARQLLRLRTAHPDALEYVIEARAPRGTSMLRSEFYWRQDTGVISVIRDTADFRTTLPIGPNLEGLLGGSVSLSEGLHRCSEGSMNDPLCN